MNSNSSYEAKFSLSILDAVTVLLIVFLGIWKAIDICIWAATSAAILVLTM